MAYYIAEQLEILKQIIEGANEMRPNIMTDDNYARTILARPLWFWPYLLFAFEAVTVLGLNIKGLSRKAQIVYFLYRTVKKGIVIWRDIDDKMLAFNDAVAKLVIPDAHHISDHEINDGLVIADREGMEWPEYRQVQT